MPDILYGRYNLAMSLVLFGGGVDRAEDRTCRRRLRQHRITLTESNAALKRQAHICDASRFQVQVVKILACPIPYKCIEKLTLMKWAPSDPRKSMNPAGPSIPALEAREPVASSFPTLYSYRSLNALSGNLHISIKDESFHLLKRLISSGSCVPSQHTIIQHILRATFLQRDTNLNTLI